MAVINEEIIATAGEGGNIKLWEWKLEKFLKSLVGHDDKKNIYFISMHPVQKNILISGGSDMSVIYFLKNFFYKNFIIFFYKIFIIFFLN